MDFFELIKRRESCRNYAEGRWKGKSWLPALRRRGWRHHPKTASVAFFRNQQPGAFAKVQSYTGSGINRFTR
jgi:hypothetical protein